MDVATLSRIQFAITIMFHYLFPPLAIGMGAFLVFLEARYLKTRLRLRRRVHDRRYHRRSQRLEPDPDVERPAHRPGGERADARHTLAALQSLSRQPAA